MTSRYWTIGFSDRKNIEKLRFQDIKWVKRQKGEWFADPFILDYDDKTISVLVEYVVNPDPIGKIAKFVIDRNTLGILSKQIILSLPTHLSFPAIIRKDGEIYFYPENSASGRLNLYRLVNDATACEYVCTLVDAPLTDAIIFERDGLSLMTATEEPDSNGRRLVVLRSDNTFGHYQRYREITMDENTARNAGYTLCEDDGKYYKISQENNSPLSSMYGHGMVFYSMSKEFSFEKVNQIEPGHGFVGVHTMNPYRDLVVWDGKKYNYPVVATLIDNIVKMIKKIKK